MGRVALMATRATELALIDAGLLGDPLLKSGHIGICLRLVGRARRRRSATSAACSLNNSTEGINATTYIKMMPHTARGEHRRVLRPHAAASITTSSACTSGSQGIGYAYEAIQCRQAGRHARRRRRGT